MSKKLGTLIPSDWDNGQWQCVKIYWPKSVHWTGVLLGLLTIGTRGRYWDERTGSVIGVQSVARDIFERNYPLEIVSCNQGETCPECGATTTGGGITIIEGDDMGQVVTDVTVENGNEIYVWFGKCCKILAGKVVSTDTSPGDITTDPTDPSSWPCNKAGGIAAMINDIVTVGIPAILGLLSPQSMATAWRAALPQYAWQEDSLQDAMAWFFNAQTEISTVLLGSTFEARIRCYFAPLMLPTDSLSESEYNALPVALIPLGTNPQVFLGYLITSLSILPFQWQARAYHQVTADCTCPEQNLPTEPTAGGWYFSAAMPELTYTVPGGAEGKLFNFAYLCPEDIFGVAYEWEFVSGDTPDTYRPSEGDASIPVDEIMFSPNSAFDSVDTFYILAGPNAYAELNNVLPGTRITIGQFSDDDQLPVATAGQYALAAFWCHVALVIESAVVKVKNVRFIMNENSPSHS